MNVRPSLSWRPKTTIILVVGLISLFVYSVAAYAAVTFRTTTPVKAGDNTYSVWVVDTEAMRRKGLSSTEKLPPNGGLLMKYDVDGYHGIWMKDMKLSIDIVWINNDKKVVHIVKNASPELSADETFAPKALARYVLELPAGSVDVSAIKVGQVASFDELTPGISW